MAKVSPHPVINGLDFSHGGGRHSCRHGQYMYHRATPNHRSTCLDLVHRVLRWLQVQLYCLLGRQKDRNHPPDPGPPLYMKSPVPQKTQLNVVNVLLLQCVQYAYHWSRIDSSAISIANDGTAPYTMGVQPAIQQTEVNGNLSKSDCKLSS